MTREEFEERELRAARDSFADRLAAGRERPGYALTPILVPVWLGFCTDRDWQMRPPPPRFVMVALPNEEEYRLDLPDDLREFDEIDLKRTADGVKVVFRLHVRFYHPTRLEGADWK